MKKLEICAELSANHNGSLDRALAIVDAAAEAGADLFKVQTWAKDTMCVDRSYVIEHGTWKGRKLFDLYQEAWLPWEWHEPIFDRARKRGMIPFSAAFDMESVDFLEKLGVDRHKVASFELTDLPLIRYMASKGKPMILSTGMATEEEIELAVEATDVAEVILLKCVSSYPADASESNLMAATRWSSGMQWGLSDHTMGIGVACAAAALGAAMIEKHLTLSRADGGPDAGFSMEPVEFKQMVTECRRAAASVGEVRYGPTKGESTALRRSWWAVRDIAVGEELTTVNVRTARPALGLSPAIDVWQKRATRDIKANTPITADCL